MKDTLKIRIQVAKFSLYGFLKNLTFFEPYLIIYFVLSGLSLFHIGLLYTVREVIIYVFEVPSGVFADRYGKKTELVICFIFYIISFFLFFIGDGFYEYAFAMAFFGLGEAFRSGTHKAMIMAYIDKMGIKDSKSKIYGHTRSFSNVGSAIANLFYIGFVFILPSMSWLFLIAIIPYLIDMLLIMSYPSFLNERVDTKFEIKGFLKENVNSIKYAFKENSMRNLLFGSASYNAGFKTIKDYIQPIIITITISYILFKNLSIEDNVYIYTGFIYMVIYIISAIASYNAYKFAKFFTIESIVKFMWLASGLSLIVLSVFINNIFVLGSVFILLYVFLNIRKPLMIEKIGDEAKSDKRASVLSIESQFTSIMIAIFAPILGLIADKFSIEFMLMIVGIIMIGIYFLVRSIKLIKKEAVL